MHEISPVKMKRPRHDPENVPEDLLEEIRLLATRNKGVPTISRVTGLGWKTIEKILDKHAITCRRQRSTADEIGPAIERYGGMDQLLAVLRNYRAQGMWWQRMAEITGLNRHACRILVEQGRVPGARGPHHD